MYGYMSCMKDGIVGLCGVNYFDLLETTYEEVIVDVIGDTFDCNEEHDPLLGELNPYMSSAHLITPDRRQSKILIFSSVKEIVLYTGESTLEAPLIL